MRWLVGRDYPESPGKPTRRTCTQAPRPKHREQAIRSEGTPTAPEPSDGSFEGRDPSDITRLIVDWGAGDPQAREALLPLIYEDLKRIAHRHLDRHGLQGRTINTTGLVHELYVNLVDHTRASWRDRAHFFAIASKAMRHILIDYIRRAKAEKHGGKHVRVPLMENTGESKAFDPDLLDLDAALSQLAEFDPRMAQVVECRFFGGMTVEETAEALSVGVRTVERDWTRARTYLLTALQD